MRYIKTPAAIQVTDRSKEPVGDPVAFSTWLEGFPLNDERVFGSGLRAIRSARRILENTANANGVIALEESDWEALCKAINAPSRPWQPAIARQYIPFMEAVVNAEGEQSE